MAMKYRFEDYNQYNVLKIPLMLVLTSIYLLKQLVIFILPMISAIPVLVKFAHQHFTIALLLSSLPVIPVLIAMLMRAPKTKSTLIRWIWQNSRLFLLSSLALEILSIVLYVVFEIKKFNEVSLIFLYIDAILIIYLFKSQRVRDVFAEFPDKTFGDNV
jgi:hypothetical protein